MIKKDEILLFLSKDNDRNYNFDKALEESAEFSEVLLKYKTKHPERKPDPKKILEEYGDLVLRGFIALLTLYPDSSIEEIKEEVKRHINKKLSKLQKFREEGL